MRIRCILIFCVAMLYSLYGIAQSGSAKTNTQGAIVTTASSPVHQEQKGHTEAAGQTQTAPLGKTTNTGETDITAEQENEAGGFHGIESEGGQDISPTDSQIAPGSNEVPTPVGDNGIHNDSTNWFPMLLSLLAFGLSGYVFYVSQVQNRRRKKQYLEKGDNNINPELRDILQQNQNLRLSLSSLNQRMDKLDEKLESILAQDQISPPQHNHSQSQENSNRSISPSVTRYAAMVTSEGFPEGNLTDSNSDYTLAILTLTGSSGTFVINNLDSAQSFLISNFAYSVGRICEIKQQNESATRVETVRAGKISRDGNTWKIISKADVILV